jgi:hypothetical protein
MTARAAMREFTGDHHAHIHLQSFLCSSRRVGGGHYQFWLLDLVLARTALLAPSSVACWKPA